MRNIIIFRRRRDLALSLIKTLKDRVAADGGTFEAETCTLTFLQTLKNIE